MWFRDSSLQQVINCFEWDRCLSPIELVAILWKSKVVIHKYLWELLKQWKLSKSGSGPQTVYQLTSEWYSPSLELTFFKWNGLVTIPELWYKDSKVIENNFFMINDKWVERSRVMWFVRYCESLWISAEQNASAYISLVQQRENKKNKSWLLECNLPNVHYVRKISTIDPVSYWSRRNSRLSELIKSAKIKQDRTHIVEIIELLETRLASYIYHNRVDAICVIPAKNQRVTQLMTHIKSRLRQYPVQIIQSFWTPSWVISVQKPSIFPLNVLLIDDSVHSGDTLNHVAFHISKRGVQHIDALCLVGEVKV